MQISGPFQRYRGIPWVYAREAFLAQTYPTQIYVFFVNIVNIFVPKRRSPEKRLKKHFLFYHLFQLSQKTKYHIQNIKKFTSFCTIIGYCTTIFFVAFVIHLVIKIM